jgi:hypothetical protein
MQFRGHRRATIAFDGEVRIDGIEGQSAQNPCRRVGREIGYAQRSQVCSEVASHD